MDGWMQEEVREGADGERTQRGCGDSRQEKKRVDGGKRDRLDREEKGGMPERQPGSQTWCNNGRR